MSIVSKFFLGFLSLVFIISGCKDGVSEKKDEVTTIVFKHGKIAGEPRALLDIIAEFEQQNPDIKVKDEPLPASTDEQHQFYVINLAGKTTDFDVLSMDVIWVPEFARAGWLKDVSSALPEEQRIEFFKGPMDAVTYNEKVYAIPWYIDAGVLYYRKDLLNKYGFYPPETWDELVTISRTITLKEKDLYGFIWQGKQYEGLVCNVLEYFWSNGGDVLKNGNVIIESPENIEALTFMKDLITAYNVTPELVLTSIEESTRHIFGNGKALFMRNWPYAYVLGQQNDSKIKDKFNTILVNPPQTAGKEICFQIIDNAKNHLKERGLLQLVARHNKGGSVLEKRMNQVFGNVEQVAKGSGYRIYVSEN
ncbi:MAG: extracellular solute-binding protein [Thermodesulfovibrionia bacterium]|nr:extracellular solute-binding protein [Thermodesulfovibrionia bacterium]